MDTFCVEIIHPHILHNMVSAYILKTHKACIYEEHAYWNTLTLYIKSFNLYIMVIYRPPSYSLPEHTHLINFITNICVGKELIILGDCNLPSLKWGAPDVTKHTSSHDKNFLDLFTTQGLTQWISEPTFLQSSNIIDLVFTTEDDHLLNITLDPPFPHSSHDSENGIFVPGLNSGTCFPTRQKWS